MIYYLLISLVYCLSILFGDIVIPKVIKYCWELLELDWNNLPEEEKKDKKFLTQKGNQLIVKRVLGALEIVLYITTYLLNHPEGIVAWLTIKTAVSWQSFDQDKRFVSPHIFLLGNVLGVLIALFGVICISYIPKPH